MSPSSEPPAPDLAEVDERRGAQRRRQRVPKLEAAVDQAVAADRHRDLIDLHARRRRHLQQRREAPIGEAAHRDAAARVEARDDRAVVGVAGERPQLAEAQARRHRHLLFVAEAVVATDVRKHAHVVEVAAQRPAALPATTG